MSDKIDEKGLLAAWLRDEMRSAQKMSARYQHGSKDRELWSAKAEKFREAAEALTVNKERIEVKRLEWDDKDYAAQAVVPPLGLTYTLQHGRDGWFAAVTGDGISEYLPGEHPTREPAKAAAQADYETRIREALEAGRSSLSGEKP